MACLNKLAIRGIRSFDDKQISVIEFFSPVTVIVGHNGSGKTTIIECLKYATTGDQPPNTRGGAFVHDPKMANEKEVKAQVKLRFHAANGTRMLAVRNLSVTVTKSSGLTMKTLESILALADGKTEKGGKRGVISTKCAEMDAEIPQLLGVSKAVLENVIFCHQEDSYWPLAEPSALKKKFDDIFEATKYTKALVSIKNLRKDRLAELKAEKERLLSLSREKAHSDKLRDRINDLKSTIASKEVECEESKHQYDAAVESNRKFYELYNKFREMYVTVEKLEENKSATKAYLAEVKSKYQELTGSLEELESRSDQFEERINLQKENKRQEERKMEDLDDEQNSQIADQRALITQKGRLVAEAEEQHRRIQQREQVIHEIGDVYGIKGFNYSPLERDKVLEFLSRLGDVQRRQQAEYEKLQSDLKAKNDDYHAKLRALDSELESRQSQKQRLRDQIVERQDKINKTERTLEDMQTIPSSLRSLQADIEDKKDRLQKLKSAISSAKYDTRLADIANKGRMLEEERDQLNVELQALTLQAESRARLELKRGEVKSKVLSINYF
ncbi:AAA domain-containing protein [Flammula alnicola]|nr:AAA domain-containing protein [Flammula alnicola]